MLRVEGDPRWLDWDVWQKLPLSYPEWWALPDLEWMRATLPWPVAWARMGQDRALVIGGWDPVVANWQWWLEADCAWTLYEDDFVFISSADEAGFPRVAERLSALAGQQVTDVGVGPGNGDSHVFRFSHGSWLVVAPNRRARWPARSCLRVHVWGGTIIDEHPDETSAPSTNSSAATPSPGSAWPTWTSAAG
jgi:hypothetical protein